MRNYDDAKAADHARYARLFHGLLDRGVFVAPSGYETLFPSLAHTDADIERTIKAAAEAAAAMDCPNFERRGDARYGSVALFAPAADAVHVEERRGEQEDHDGEREERLPPCSLASMSCCATNIVGS